MLSCHHKGLFSPNEMNHALIEFLTNGKNATARHISHFFIVHFSLFIVHFFSHCFFRNEVQVLVGCEWHLTQRPTSFASSPQISSN